MKIRLAYLNKTIDVCQRCHGDPAVEAQTGPHGPVLDARQQDDCEHCTTREPERAQ